MAPRVDHPSMLVLVASTHFQFRKPSRITPIMRLPDLLAFPATFEKAQDDIIGHLPPNKKQKPCSLCSNTGNPIEV